MSSMYLLSYLPTTLWSFTRPVEKQLANEHTYPTEQLLPPFLFYRNSPKHNLQRNLAKEKEVRKVFLVKPAKMGNISKKKQINKYIHHFPEFCWLQILLAEQSKQPALL